jgi:hypothetical protein
MLRRVVPLFFILFSVALAAIASAPPTDDYLAGYITAVVQMETGLAPGAFQVAVRAGSVVVTLPTGQESLRAAIEKRLAGLEGLQGLTVRVARPQASSEEVSGVEPRRPKDLSSERTFERFPAGNLFRPLLADPKQPQFFVSLRSFHTSLKPIDSSVQTFTMASVGYGENFGLAKWSGTEEGDGLQLSLDGALFAQFNMDAPSHDLINADYQVGIPLTYRRGLFSARLRVYHQSSHLGDEFLLRYRPDRVNLSYESVQALGAMNFGKWRVYAGGEYFFDRDPGTLRPAGAQAGIEYRGQTRRFMGPGSFVAGLDLKSYQENAWGTSGSLKAGYEFGLPDPGRRHLKIMLEGYKGFAPYGQFYQERVSYFGVGIYFNF